MAHEPLPVPQGHRHRTVAAELPVVQVREVVAFLVGATAGHLNHPTSPRGIKQPLRGYVSSRRGVDQRINGRRQGDELPVDDGDPACRLEFQPFE